MTDFRQPFGDSGFCEVCGDQYPEHKPGCKWATPEDRKKAKVRAGMVHVRMELQGMKQVIQQAFHTEYIPGLQASADAAIEETMKAFDFQRHVMEAAHKALNEFTSEVISEVIKEVIDNDAMREKVRKQVMKSAKKWDKEIAQAAIEAVEHRLQRRY